MTITSMRDIVAEITRERGSVYGQFLHNALVAQAIKAALRNIPDPDNEGHRWESLPMDVREGLDLIALKMSRIVTGDCNHLDNWDDIGGYAKIVADRIRNSVPHRVPLNTSPQERENDRTRIGT